MELYHYSEDKFSEAEFFLRLMSRNTDKVSDFRYYFSAFLSATRSVSYVWTDKSKIDRNLQLAYKEHFENDDLVYFIVNIRDQTIHQGNIMLNISKHRFIGQVESEFGRYRWSFPNFPTNLPYENDVLEICDEALSRIHGYLVDIWSHFME